ncbi:hypothetical protein SAMN02799630_00933 [Paenibacillus sp. UNCCL117]|uniref:hypothetical protein n=1 Tax=unclassified Paenibacillus TaxID=185978 RepID=UPI000882188F|nr:MULTISPECIES: hypothetical protein [unclassified Paenibacillus]SDC25726.1 hypothetical protein SAMN04488602_101735 [Paenibacillus sp. cl123]SFW19896.1 hypothetical protein SAMN02799630_00933 [Paenibacillus sp. UNCCL117]
MGKAVISLIALIVLSAGMMYSPWVTEGFAKRRVIGAFEDQGRKVQDGCGFNCKDCGVKGSKKAPFGRMVSIEYACGLLPADSPEFHQRGQRFVSFLGTVH